MTDWASRRTAFTHDLANRVTSITRPNGTVRQISYDTAGETTNIIEKTTTGFPIAFFTLGWTNSGRVAWEFGAPLPHTNPPPTRTMEFDDDNRLKTFNSQTVTNDADGNLTWGPLTNNTHVSYGYDARNRLLTAGGLNYGYDPAGSRTSVTNGTNVVRFVVNPNAALSQTLMRITGGTTNYYIYGLGLLYEVTETATSTNMLTYHYDYRGSTVALTDANGMPTDRIEYSAYGMTTYRAGTNNTPFLYNGRYGVQTDPNGLLYMRARYYNPYLCRFINPDPAGFGGGLNWYCYADGNPVSMIDPFGLCSVGETGGRSWLSGLAENVALGLEDMEWHDRQQYLAPKAPMIDGVPFVGNLVNASSAAWRGDVSATDRYANQLGGEALATLLTVGMVKMIPVPAAESTVPSIYRVTQEGESFIRYESGNPAFSRATTEGGLIPRTYAAPSSEGLLPQSSLNAQYNLWSPEIPRVNAFHITPPAGTPIIGPRPVVGGLGNEVIFPMGVPPGSVGPVIPVPPH
jgi:RHS repeat-associated protein